MRFSQVTGTMLALTVMCAAAPVYTQVADTTTGARFLATTVSGAQATFLAGLTNSAIFDLESIAVPTLTGSMGSVSGETLSVTACTNCDTSGNFEVKSGVSNNTPTFNQIGYNTTGATNVASSAGHFYMVGGAFGTSSYLTTTFTLNFSTPVHAFGAYLTGVQTAVGTVTASFNDGAAQSIVLLNSAVNANNAGSQFFGFTTTGLVSSITFTTTNIGTGSNAVRDVWGIDDIVLGNFSSVPEPATFGLMGVALLGLGALRFRKR